MDERLEKALEFSNHRMTVETQRKNLLQRVETLQTVHYGGGSFKADEVLIAFTKAMVDNETETFILKDLRENPITIADPVGFLEKIISSYNGAMNEFSVESKKLSKARNIKTIMDW